MIGSPEGDFKRLVSTLTATGKKYDIDKIKNAYEYASRMHEGQKRLSGEHYITHPVAVAQIVAGIEIDFLFHAGEYSKLCYTHVRLQKGIF